MLSRLLAGSGGGAIPLWVVAQTDTISSSPNFYMYKWNPGVGFTGYTSQLVAGVDDLAYAKVMTDGSALFHSWYNYNGSPYFAARPFNTSTGAIGSTYSFTATKPTDGGSLQRIAIHPDKDVVAVTQSSFPWINVYQFSQALGLHTRYANAATNAGRGAASIDWSPDGTVLLYNSYGWDYEQNLFAWEFDKTTGFGSQYTNPPPTLTYYTYSGRWSPDGTKIAYGRSGGDYVAIVTWPSGGWSYGNQFEPSATGVSAPGEPVRAIAWSPDGRYIACGLDTVLSGRSICVYKINSNGTFAQIFLTSTAGIPTARVNDIAFSPDGRTIFWGADSAGAGYRIGAIEWFGDDGFGDVYAPTIFPSLGVLSVSVAPRTP